MGTLPLTSRQARFARHYAWLGNGTQAARLAGYADHGGSGLRVEAHRLLRKPHVAAAIREHQERVLETAGVDPVDSIVALSDVAADRTAPGAARVHAATRVLQLLGAFPDAGRPVERVEPRTAAMDTAELNALVEKLQAERFGQKSDGRGVSLTP